uniref:Uncharacterized protein n=1 Tax=Picea glauca TaxID=3330 RepID=A0A101LVW8_PICGL|nr:hypothetical protein ABT39_MTgene1811 [Picea glauca]QHR91834.1 hypothetical protein Q903MT_gene5870 [Picea sitchensis]
MAGIVIGASRSRADQSLVINNLAYAIQEAMAASVAADKDWIFAPLSVQGRQSESRLPFLGIRVNPRLSKEMSQLMTEN